MIIPDRRRVKKEVRVNGRSVVSLFDTGSDIIVAQMKTLKRYKFGEMRKCNFQFDAVGAQNQAIGYVNVKVDVDDECYDDICFIIEDQENFPDLIIGLSLINQGELTVNESGVTMKKVHKKTTEDDNKNNEWSLKPMCALIMETQTTVPDLIHIRIERVKKEVKNLVTQYKPNKTKEFPVELKLILNDKIPVYQRTRRFPPKLKEIVDKQVNEWLENGVIRPSVSDFAVPVVPVPKKDGSTRIRVDYRPVNASD